MPISLSESSQSQPYPWGSNDGNSQSIMRYAVKPGRHQMVRIEVSSEQAERILRSDEAIELFDDGGRCIGYFSRPITESEIAEAKRRSATEETGSSLDDIWKRIESEDCSK